MNEHFLLFITTVMAADGWWEECEREKVMKVVRRLNLFEKSLSLSRVRCVAGYKIRIFLLIIKAISSLFHLKYKIFNCQRKNLFFE
jgi:hypothetical protein